MLVDWTAGTAGERSPAKGVDLITLGIPGRGELRLEHLVLDMNGTIAVDGVVVGDVAERVHELATQLSVHVVTADTFGTARRVTGELGGQLLLLERGRSEAQQKAELVDDLGAGSCVAVGNGANDVLMFKAAALAIGVLGREGMAAALAAAADVITTDPVDALDLLLHPKRLIATLRS